MADWASRARFWIQFFFLECMLYFSPFWSKVVYAIGEGDVGVVGNPGVKSMWFL